MKILIHDYPGHPFQIDLSKELSNRGYDVWHVYTSASGGPKGGLVAECNRLDIIDLGGDSVEKQNFIKRRSQEKKYGRKIVAKIDEIKPDLVISSNTPLDAQIQIASWCSKNNVPFIFWLQDIISVAMKSILKNKFGLFGGLVASYYERVEKKCLKLSSHIIVIADEFKGIITPWGIEEKKITTIPNWAPIEEIPIVSKSNDFAKKYDLKNKFVVLYSGTLGMKHNPELLFEAASELRSKKDILFLVISEGQGMEYLKRRAKSDPLPNLILLPFQPFEEFPNVLGSSDCTVILLEPEAGIFSVPSKVWSGYCAQKASVLVVPKKNLAARITESINAGIVVGDNSSISETLLYLFNNPIERERMGKNGRDFAENNFYVSRISEKFEDIFEATLKNKN